MFVTSLVFIPLKCLYKAQEDIKCFENVYFTKMYLALFSIDFVFVMEFLLILVTTITITWVRVPFC